MGFNLSPDRMFRFRCTNAGQFPEPFVHIHINHAPFSSGLENLRGMPAKAVDRRGPRLVFAADPAAIANGVEMAKQKGIVDFPGARLVAAGIVGELHMADAVEVL